MTASGDKKRKRDSAEAQPLSVMLGLADRLSVGGKEFEVLPLPLKDVEAFMKDEVSVGSQLFNFINETNRKRVDKWIKKYVRDADGEPYSLQRAMDDGWTLRDLREMFQRMLDISG